MATGLGVVTSIGLGKSDFWHSLLKGCSGISRVTAFDTAAHRRHYAGEIKNFDPRRYFSHRLAKFFGRASQLAIAAAQMALEDASLSPKGIRQNRCAVIAGTTVPEGRAVDSASELLLKGRPQEITPYELLSIFSPSLPGNLGHFFRLGPINMLIPCACAAGNYAISRGYDLIKKGEADIALVGGAEAFSRVAFQGFQSLYAMAPERCSPFDRNRKGMLLGEGAAILILEEREAAFARHARVYAEILGYGLSCDAHHMTIPEQRGVVQAMEKALHNAGIGPEDVDYISAHGTGTLANDKVEAAAVKEVFYRGGRRVPMSSIKSMLGHCMGAASSIEAVACCMALQENTMPPTINYETPDPDCDIDCVANRSRAATLTVALNNSFAFGGNNCCVVFRAP